MIELIYVQYNLYKLIKGKLTNEKLVIRKLKKVLFFYIIRLGYMGVLGGVI